MISEKILILGYNKNVEKYFENRMEIFKMVNIKNIITFLRINDIKNLIILNEKFDIDFYNDCIKNDINILNEKIYFINFKIIERIIRNTLKIPIFRRTATLTDYNNLIIESLERKYPQLLKSGDNVLLKINDSAEFIYYKQHIKNFIYFFKYDKDIYLQEISDNFNKISILFINKNEFKILDSFDVIYTILKYNIIMKSPSKFLNKMIINDSENIAKHFGMKFGMIEFIINGPNVFFYRIINIDKLLHFKDFFKNNYNFDIYKFKFDNNYDSSHTTSYSEDITLINEIDINYNNFFPFFGINNKKDYFCSNFNIHYKSSNDNINDIFELLKKCYNLYFKEIIYNNVNKINFNLTNIHNIFNKDNTYFFRISYKKNNNIFFKNSENSNIYMNSNIYNTQPRDNYNSKLANFILDNNNSCTIIEIINNSLSLIFYNTTFITITGSPSVNISIKNKGKYKVNTIIKLNYKDELIINAMDNNINYIAFSNGIQLNLSKKNDDYNSLIENEYILFNKSKSDIFYNKNKIDFLLPNFCSNYNLKIIESSFTDYFNNKLIKYIYKCNWSVKKANNNYILLHNKFYTKIYRKYNVESSILKRYCKGSVIFNKEGLLIVNNNNYDYYDGLSIMTVISSDNWKINYIYENTRIYFQKVSLDYAINKRKAIDDTFNRQDTIYRSIKYTAGINRTNIVQLSFTDKINLINIECRLMGDKHLLVNYNLDVNDKLKDNMFIEFAFRQKLIETNGKLKYVFGLSSYIVKFDDTDIDKIVLEIYTLEKRISISNKIKTKIIKLPTVLDKKYFSDSKYVNSLLKINGIDNINDVKNFIERMKFIVIDVNSVNSDTLCLLPYNPENRMILVKRDINQQTENGTISFGNFFSNIHYTNKIQKNTIISKTIPLTDNKLNFVLKRFDIIKFKIMNNNSFNSILNHNKVGKYYLDSNETEFSISEYRNFFNNGLDKFIEKKYEKINIYDKEKNLFNSLIPNHIVNIFDVKAEFDCIITVYYVKLNDYIKLDDKICKIIDKNRIKSNIKSNIIGMITKIHIGIGQHIKKNDTIISILQC